jgi:hypothetical protein
VGLQRRPLGIVSTTEELFGIKRSGSGLDENMAVGIRYADYTTSSISKRWHYLRRQEAVFRSV